MKKLLLTTLGMMILLHVQAQTTVLNIPATTSTGIWTDTGISVTSGEIIRINADGTWRPPGSRNAITADGFNTGGDFDLFFDNAQKDSLIAYIGSDPTQGHYPDPTGSFFPQTTGYWAVGTSVQFVANTGGELWLGMNDFANGDSDGSSTNGAFGSQMVQIFLNNATNDLTTNYAPNLSFGSFSGNGNNIFSFTATNGPPFTVWSVYDSSDATNWVYIGPLTLNQQGWATLQDYSAVSRRYYKLDNGICHSLPYGFQIFNVQFSYSGSPQQIWSDSFNVNGYWNVVQGASFDDNDNPIYPTFGGAFDGQAVNEATLFDGSGSFSEMGLAILSYTPGSGEPPVIFHNSISPSTDPLSENVLCVTSGVDEELVLDLEPAAPSLPPVVYNINFFSYNAPADSVTTFTPIHYSGPFSVSLPSSATSSDSSTYVSFNGLAGGTWTFDLSGTELGPCCNGLQIVAIGRPLPLY